MTQELLVAKFGSHAVRLLEQGQPPRDAAKLLMQAGVPKDLAYELVFQAHDRIKRRGWVKVALGVVILAGGVLATFATGGRGVFYGAIAVGLGLTIGGIHTATTGSTRMGGLQV